MFLTDDEFEELQNMEFSQNDWLWFYTQAVENKLLEKLKAQEPFAFHHDEEGLSYSNHYTGTVPLYRHPLPPDDVVRDPRVAELEAVLRECREALVHCEGVLDEVRDYPITYDLTIEAITKIYEVLK